MNDIFALAGTAVVSAGIIILLKQYRPEYAFGASLAAGIILFMYSINVLQGIFEYINDLVSVSGIEKSGFEVLLRCLGICLTVKIASDICRDCGQSSIAAKVDFAGKVFMLTAAMPLFTEIFKIIEILMNI